MILKTAHAAVAALGLSLAANGAATAQSPDTSSPADPLIAALLGETPMIDDVQYLTDTIGGRVTGTDANLKSVDWTMKRFKDAGVAAEKDPFMMDHHWADRSTIISIDGDGISFSPRAVAKFFSAPTDAEGLTAKIVGVGKGSPEDFKRAGNSVKDAWVLIETGETRDISGLFAEHTQAADVEPRAVKAGVAGIVFMSSRPNGLLYRLSAQIAEPGGVPVIIMERAEAARLQRLLAAGADLTMNAVVDVEFGPSYESYNVIGEIPGGDLKDEIVVIGAHLDSHGLGTGANDNAANVAMLIDIARQMKRQNIQPRRTVRFILWNGEEQGLVGSWRYVAEREEEMENHLMAMSIDIGSGRINGFFTNGRGGELGPILDSALNPVGGMGPYSYLDEPIVGTDNFDFIISGVANLVASHESANYGLHYHAETDTFDKVDQRQLRLNAAIIAAVTMEFANSDITLPRHTRRQIKRLVEGTSLKDQMKTFGVYEAWKAGEQGRK